VLRFDAAGIGSARDLRGCFDCDLFADAYGYAVGGEIDSFAARAESGGACLLLRTLCAYEC
jgi:hypothetical protein